MTRPAHLSTARLQLRPVAASDEAAIVSQVGNLAVSRWLSSVPHPYTAADFQHFAANIAKPGETFIISDEQGFAGVVGITAELGYWLCPRAQGRGYATEAAHAVLAMQFSTDPSDVIAGHFADNAASARVLAKLGFVETGRGMRTCRALAMDLAHVDLVLTREKLRFPYRKKPSH